jgi:YaiO family outer membrane protein
MFEQDAYYTIRNRDYIFANIAYSPNKIFPEIKAGLEYHKPFAKTWEASLGARYFHFKKSDVILTTFSISKYYGKFLGIFRPFLAIENGEFKNFSFNLENRWYRTDYNFASIFVNFGYDPGRNLFSLNEALLNTNEAKKWGIGIRATHTLSNHFNFEEQVAYSHWIFTLTQRDQISIQIKLIYKWN